MIALQLYYFFVFGMKHWYSVKFLVSWQQQTLHSCLSSHPKCLFHSSFFFPLVFTLLLVPPSPSPAVNTFVHVASESYAEPATSDIQCQQMQHLVRGIIRPDYSRAALSVFADANVIFLSGAVSSAAECHLAELKFINPLIACKHQVP